MSKQRKWHRERLTTICECRPRAPNCVMPMTEEESQLVCQLTLQSWGHLTHLLATASEEVSSYFVLDPVAWAANRKETVVHARDAVP
eukprot:4084265-Alexandrium_andersonii.AAC.1